ncbi:MAG: NADH-quinone oxidoreductase subunit NuoN [Alphaproteobacteria bacterium]
MHAHIYTLALPEIVLACAAMALLMVGVFKNDSTRLVGWLAVATLAVVAWLVLQLPDERQVTFAGMFVNDPMAKFAKVLILLGTAGALILSLNYIQRENMNRFEYPVLFLLAALGMLMMVSANDLISLYMGIEVQSLALYVVAAFRRESRRSSEAGLKYFVLGALSSGMMLYGCSLIYGFTGTTSFEGIHASIGDIEHAGLGLLAGIVFLVAGLAFKVSAVPFHMWTPDVYEGAPTPVTAFFAVAPKIAALVLFMRAMIVPFGEITADWQQIITFISIASMLLGAFAAIGQRNIKRLMAYSSIGHVGYALIGLAAGTPEGVRGVLVYMAIYLAMNVGAFGVILCMRRRTGMEEDIGQLAGLSRTSPLLALALGIFMFSMAGIPPLAGFFGKLYVFMAAVNAELYVLAVVGVLTSVVGAFYYLRIVKVMYFDDPVEPFEPVPGMEMKVVLTICAVFVMFFILYPAPLLTGAEAAAVALWPS